MEINFDDLVHVEFETPLLDISAVMLAQSEILDEIFVVEHINIPDVCALNLMVVLWIVLT